MTLRPAPDETCCYILYLNERAAVPSEYGNDGDGDGVGADDDDDDNNVTFTHCDRRGERAVFGEVGKGRGKSEVKGREGKGVWRSLLALRLWVYDVGFGS